MTEAPTMAEEETTTTTTTTSNNSSETTTPVAMLPTGSSTTMTTTTLSSHSSKQRSDCLLRVKRRHLLFLVVAFIFFGFFLLLRQNATLASSPTRYYNYNQQQQPLSHHHHNNNNNKRSPIKSLQEHQEQQDIRLVQEASKSSSSSSGGPQTPEQQEQHPPVFQENDPDKPLPGTTYSPGTLHAAEALLCRQSVINFVINATDAKDECEGLKKAFDKTCSNDDDDDAATADGDADGADHNIRRQRRRRTLWEKTQDDNRFRLFFYETYKRVQRLVRLVKTLLQQEHPLDFFAEDEILEQYADAQCLVDNNLVQAVHRQLQRQWQQEHRIQRQQRHLQQTTTAATSSTTAATSVASNKTSTTTSTSKTLSKSIQLPTSSQHVSDKVLEETLILHQGDKVIEKAQNQSSSSTSTTSKQQQQQQEAKDDAATSSKAMADTNAAVAAVLNDPTSVEARTCCASILNVYHENCSTEEEGNLSDSRLFFVVFVMALCGIVKSLIRHYKILWLPEAAGCILVGVLSGYILMFFPHHDISFDGNWFLRILVPPIIFEAALSIDKRSFNRHVVPIMMYAIAGTLMATGLTAFVVHRGTNMLQRFCAPIPYVEALTFGALISSIDPIAVLSVLSNMGMTDTDTIYVVIFGESLLNDGVSIVLFHTLVHFLDENLVIDSDAVYAASIHFLVVAIGSLLIGVASGLMSTVFYWLFYGCQTPLVEVIMFFCWALLPYYICDGIGWSGIVCSVVTGFVMDIYIVGQKQGDTSATPMNDDSEVSNGSNPSKIGGGGGRRRIFSSQGLLSDEARQHIGFVTEIISETMETAIFAYLGFFLFSHRYHWNILHIIIAILACCISRGIMIPTLSFVANWITRIQQHRAAGCRMQPAASRKPTAANSYPSTGVVIDKRMQLVLWFAGLRGAMSFALVEHIPLYDSTTGEGTRLKPELKAMTSASIMFTVFILGGYTYYMMEYLGMTPSSSSSSSTTLSSSSPSAQPSTEMVSLIPQRQVGKSRSGEDFVGNESIQFIQQEPMSSRKTAFRRQRQQSAPSDDDIGVY